MEETESFVVTLVTEDPAVLIMLPFASVTIMDSTGKYLFVLDVIRQRHQIFGHS